MADTINDNSCDSGCGIGVALLLNALAAPCGGGYGGGILCSDFMVYSRPLTQL